MTNRVSAEDVRHVAMLARLGLSEQRVGELTKELNTILEHMEVLSQVDTSGIGEAVAGEDTGMRLRDDNGPAIPLEEPPESFAPEMREGFFIVPRLASHGDTGSDAPESSA